MKYNLEKYVEKVIYSSEVIYNYTVLNSEGSPEIVDLKE